MAFYIQNRCIMALVALLSMATIAIATSSADVFICASINTASMSGNTSTFQSDGLCYDFCKEDYALAVVQDTQCWCSNYVPAKAVQVDANDCDSDCPGYPDDKCGGGTSLWGYMSLTMAASGTSGAATSTASSKKTTTQNTVTFSPTIQGTSTTNGVTTDQAQNGATTRSPSISVATTIQDGSVIFQTVTVAPTVSPASDAAASSVGATSSHSGLTTGEAVGIAVGVFGFFILLGAAGAFLWLRRKRREQEERDNENSVRGSSAGMMGTPTTGMASVWDGDSTGRRNSRLMPHDPRMDPSATNIYTRFDNKSQESINTLRDDYDYSRRVLRTTNPDP